MEQEALVQLKKTIAGEVIVDDVELEAASTDWSIFHIKPQVVVQPKDSADIQSLVRFATEHNISLTARSAGTDMSGGPLNDGVIVDMTQHFSGILDVQRKDFPQQSSFYGHEYAVTGYATALPGTYYRDFEPATLKKGLLMPCYPASRDLCTIGGMVANNGAGEKTLKYGQNKDFVHALKVVFSDGNEYEVQPLTFTELQQKIAQNDFEGNMYKEIYTLVKNNWELIQEKRPQTSKNAAGYYLWDVVQVEGEELETKSVFDTFESGEGFFDLTKLIVGAQGTTGIITEITYKLVDNQPAHDLLVVYVKDLDVVPDLVRTLMQHDLETLEMYDDNTFKIGIKFFKDFMKDKGLWGSIKYVWRFLPEVWMALTKGIPRLIVLAEFVGSEEKPLHVMMREAMHDIESLSVSARALPRDADEEKFWDFRHDSFKILTEHSSEAREQGAGTRTVPFIDDIAVNPEYLPEYLPKLIAILDEYQLMYTIAGHLGNGNFHIIPLMDVDEIGDGTKLLEISDRVYRLALEYHGSITAEHNDGIIRTPYLAQQFGDDMVELFQQVKNIFDPHNIFNPGKKVGSTKEDITKHIFHNT